MYLISVSYSSFVFFTCKCMKSVLLLKIRRLKLRLKILREEHQLYIIILVLELSESTGSIYVEFNENSDRYCVKQKGIRLSCPSRVSWRMVCGNFVGGIISNHCSAK